MSVGGKAAIAAAVLLPRAGIVARGPVGTGFLTGAAWVIFAYLVLNTLMNLTSSHAGERWGMGTVTLVTAVLCWIIARAPAVE
jgi:hypothetical protein